MSRRASLLRQIALSLSLMVLGVILLSVVGTYVFYAVASTYSPGSISQTWMPSRAELVWMIHFCPHSN